MNSTILDELHGVEGTGVEILLAVESGSRAWGFASTDSDYDVRFVYMRPVREYLRLDKVRDVIDWRLDDDLDIVGWDVFKFLGLLVKSNPTAFEWLGSKIVYMEDDRFQSVRNVAPRCFDPKKKRLPLPGDGKEARFQVHRGRERDVEALSVHGEGALGIEMVPRDSYPCSGAVQHAEGCVLGQGNDSFGR